MYAPFNVPALLGRPLEVSLTKDSGLAGLIFLIRQHLGWDLPKDDPGLQRVYAWMSAEFDNGRQTSIEWEEIAPRVRQEIRAPQPSEPAVPASR
jgi:2-phosphinomethylmalic acid synthase